MPPFVIKIKFLMGAYHARPWGTHPNQNIAEWPPNPFRLLRTAVSGSFTSGQTEADRLAMVKDLSAVPAIYATESFNRMSVHWVKRPEKNGKSSEGLTLKKSNAYADSATAVGKVWFVYENGVQNEQAIKEALQATQYFGRADSPVEWSFPDDVNSEWVDKWSATTIVDGNVTLNAKDASLPFAFHVSAEVSDPKRILNIATTSPAESIKAGKVIPRGCSRQYYRKTSNSTGSVSESTEPIKWASFRIDQGKETPTFQTNVHMMNSVRRFIAPKGKRNEIMVHLNGDTMTVEFLTDDPAFPERANQLMTLYGNRKGGKWFPVTDFYPVETILPEPSTSYLFQTPYNGDLEQMKRIADFEFAASELNEIMIKGRPWVMGSFKTNQPEQLLTIGQNPGWGIVTTND